MGISRKLERKKAQREEREARGPKGADHRKLPVGKLISPPIKGEFLCLPLFGWIGLREKIDIPLVMLTVMLIRDTEVPEPKGTLQLELPVWPDTEAATVAALARFGWDGRIWPRDAGWPEGSDADAENITELLTEAKLQNTLAFPPNDSGNACQAVTVSRSRGPFLMPPLPVPEDVDPFLRESLRALCADPRPFYPVEKKLPETPAIMRQPKGGGVV